MCISFQIASTLDQILDGGPIVQGVREIILYK